MDVENSKERVKCTDANYPPWTCSECAHEAGGKWPDGHVGTFHNNICPVCGEEKAVTEPRDYGHPNFKEVLKNWQGLH